VLDLVIIVLQCGRRVNRATGTIAETMMMTTDEHSDVTTLVVVIMYNCIFFSYIDLLCSQFFSNTPLYTQKGGFHFVFRIVYI